jgi:polyvinyl alcohol dehydrogenase (cytochrome)
VLALRKDGSVAWKKYTVEPPSTGVGIWSTLSVDEAGGMVIAGTGNNYTGPASDTSDAFLALDLAQGDGDFLWKAQIHTGDVFVSRQSNGNPDADFGANPILFDLDGRKLAAGGNKGGEVWVVDRTNGSIIKERTIGPASAFKGGVFNNGAWDGSSILVICNGATSTGPGSEDAPAANVATLFALDPLTLDIKWERQVNGPAFSPITVANGVGFVGKGSTLQAFDTATGEVLKEFPTEGTIVSAAAVSDGYVVFGSGMSWIGTVPGTKYYALKVP